MFRPSLGVQVERFGFGVFWIRLHKTGLGSSKSGPMGFLFERCVPIATEIFFNLTTENLLL